MAYDHLPDFGNYRRFSELVHPGEENAKEDRGNGQKAVDEKQVVQELKRNNWIVLGILTLGGLLAVNPFFGLSVLIGGLIVIGNFGLLHRSILSWISNPKRPKSSGGVLARYYLRIMGTGLIMIALMALKWVTPIGLVVGLSTVMVNIAVCGLFIIKRAWIKEA
jgi:hypothetical protein